MIDIGKGNVCSLSNIRMLLKGPNRDADPESFMTDMNFEMVGNEKSMREFFTHVYKQSATMPDGWPNELYRRQYCIILVKSGTLRIRNCTMSLE